MNFGKHFHSLPFILRPYFSALSAMKDLLSDDEIFEAFSQLEEDDSIPVIPMRNVLYPYEWRHEVVTDPKLLEVLLGVYETKRCVGMLYNTDGEKSLPVIGSVGTIAAFGIQKLGENGCLVKYVGLPRFKTLEYLEYDTLYPQTEYEIFQDEDEDEDEVLSAARHLVELMKETERVRGYRKKNFVGDPYKMLDSPRGAVTLSFFIMKFWGGLHETRHYMINLRSTAERLKHAIHLVSEYNKNEAVAERLRHNN